MSNLKRKKKEGKKAVRRGCIIPCESGGQDIPCRWPFLQSTNVNLILRRGPQTAHFNPKWVRLPCLSLYRSLTAHLISEWSQYKGNDENILFLSFFRLKLWEMLKITTKNQTILVAHCPHSPVIIRLKVFVNSQKSCGEKKIPHIL